LSCVAINGALVCFVYMFEYCLFSARNLQAGLSAWLFCCKSFLYKNLRELSSKFDARNLHKFLVQVSCLCFVSISIPGMSVECHFWIVVCLIHPYDSTEPNCDFLSLFCVYVVSTTV